MLWFYCLLLVVWAVTFVCFLGGFACMFLFGVVFCCMFLVVLIAWVILFGVSVLLRWLVSFVIDDSLVVCYFGCFGCCFAVCGLGGWCNIGCCLLDAF